MSVFGVGVVVAAERRQNYSQLSVLSNKLDLLNGEN